MEGESIRNRIVGLQWVNPSELKANPKNWRRHPRAQRDALAGVLREIGFADALIARETPEGLELIDGHLRREIGGMEKVPVLVVDLDQGEADKLLATLDPLAAMAQPDMDSLLALLQEVKFESPDVTAMLEALANGETQPMPFPGQTDPDDVPPEPEESYVKRGDIWQCGEHRVMCGDSTKAEDVERLMDGAKADAVISDPPYGMRLNADFSGMVNNLEIAQAKGLKRGRKYDQVAGDDQDFNAAPVIAAFDNPSQQLWFGADYYGSTLQDTEHSGAWLVWDKRLDESADKMFGSCFELIWSKQKCRREILRFKWAGVFGTEKEPQRGRQHPNQKPVVLLVDLVGRTSGIAADPFLGSGTTLIACERLGRICYGMEIEPRYVQVSIERWQNYTGRKAVKLDHGD